MVRLDRERNKNPSGKDGCISAGYPFLDSSKRSYRSNKWRGSNSRYYIPTHVSTQRARKSLGTLKSAAKSFAKSFCKGGGGSLRGLDFFTVYTKWSSFFLLFCGSRKFGKFLEVWIFENLNKNLKIRKLEKLKLRMD